MRVNTAKDARDRVPIHPNLTGTDLFSMSSSHVWTDVKKNPMSLFSATPGLSVLPLTKRKTKRVHFTWRQSVGVSHTVAMETAETLVL